MKELAKIFKTIFVIGFSLNFVWEVTQTELYHFTFKKWYEFIIIHMRVSLGDVGFIILIYLVGAVITKEINWFVRLTIPRILFIIVSGFVIGVTAEKINILAGRWSYDGLMPLVPYLDVGLSPVLQMTLLPFATFLIARRFI